MPTVILRNVSDQGHHVGNDIAILITLVTSVYRKTNVFLTTVGTVTPPDGKRGEWSPLWY